MMINQAAVDANGLFEGRLTTEISRFADRFAIVPLQEVLDLWHSSRRVAPPPPPVPADAEALNPQPTRSRQGGGGGGGGQATKARRQIFVGQLRPAVDPLALPAAVEYILQAPRSVDGCDMLVGKNGSRYGFLNFRSDEHIEGLLQLNRHVYITRTSVIYALPAARIVGDKTLQNLVRQVQRGIAGLDTETNPANTVVFDGARFGVESSTRQEQQPQHGAAPPAYVVPAGQAPPHHHQHHQHLQLHLHHQHQQYQQHQPAAPPLVVHGPAPFPGGGLLPAPYYHQHASASSAQPGFGLPPPMQHVGWGQPVADSNGAGAFLLQHQYHQFHAHHQHQHHFAPPPPLLPPQPSSQQHAGPSRAQQPQFFHPQHQMPTSGQSAAPLPPAALVPTTTATPMPSQYQ